MGRYYSGDINGKFWFGVQSSDDASFFGGTECEPSYIEYSFSKANDWQSVIDGLNKCVKELGDYREQLDTFFRTHDSYSDQELATYLGLTEEETKEKLMWYARLELGKKIKDCLQEQEYCNFEAEL